MRQCQLPQAISNENNDIANYSIHNFSIEVCFLCVHFAIRCVDRMKFTNSDRRSAISNPISNKLIIQTGFWFSLGTHLHTSQRLMFDSNFFPIKHFPVSVSYQLNSLTACVGWTNSVNSTHDYYYLIIVCLSLQVNCE